MLKQVGYIGIKKTKLEAIQIIMLSRSIKRDAIHVLFPKQINGILVVLCGLGTCFSDFSLKSIFGTTLFMVYSLYIYFYIIPF